MDSGNEQQAIEQAFSKSWDSIEVFFANHSIYNEWLKPIFKLIAELRKRGYDKKFRAGQGMFRFQLSRSREHGLRRDQSMLGFEVLPEGGLHVIYFETSEIIEINVGEVLITPEIETLLARLLAHPID